MSDEYVAFLNIMSTRTENGMEIADKIMVTLMRTAMFTTKDFDPINAVVKTSNRTSLYDALDVANIWLNREKA